MRTLLRRPLLLALVCLALLCVAFAQEDRDHVLSAEPSLLAAPPVGVDVHEAEALAMTDFDLEPDWSSQPAERVHYSRRGGDEIDLRPLLDEGVLLDVSSAFVRTQESMKEQEKHERDLQLLSPELRFSAPIGEQRVETVQPRLHRVGYDLLRGPLPQPFSDVHDGVEADPRSDYAALRASGDLGALPLLQPGLDAVQAAPQPIESAPAPDAESWEQVMQLRQQSATSRSAVPAESVEVRGDGPVAPERSLWPTGPLRDETEDGLLVLDQGEHRRILWPTLRDPIEESRKYGGWNEWQAAAFIWGLVVVLASLSAWLNWPRLKPIAVPAARVRRSMPVPGEEAVAPPRRRMSGQAVAGAIATEFGAESAEVAQKRRARRTADTQRNVQAAG